MHRSDLLGVRVCLRVSELGAGPTNVSASFTKSAKRLRRRSRVSRPKLILRPQVLLLLNDSKWLMEAEVTA